MKFFDPADRYPAFEYGNPAPADAPPGSYTYALVKSGPDVDPDEVESSDVMAVEVVIMWGTTVLHVQHLSPPRSFYVGEGNADDGPCDYVVPAEKIGAERVPVVLVDGGSVKLVVLAGSEGTIELPGKPTATLARAVVGGASSPCTEVTGARQIDLVPGTKARLELHGLVFQVAAVPRGKVPAHGLFVGDDTSGPVYVGLSLLAHVGLLASMAFFIPPMGLNDGESASREQRYLMMQYLQSSSERERDTGQSEQQSDSEAHADTAGAPGSRAIGEEGKMGNPTSTQTNRRYAIEGPATNVDLKVARETALRDMHERSLIGVLERGVGGDPNAPTARWGGDVSLGADPFSARGNIWGDGIGEAIGGGAWALTGIGESGGGSSPSVGLGEIGTIGGQVMGHGHDHGRLGTVGHATKAPAPREGILKVNGRIPAEVIQRIVRQNFGRFRLCFENGLRSNPNLQGRVEVRFVIARDGAVASVGNGASDLPDAAVVRCVMQAYYGLSFPAPEGGQVKVVYPIIFSPG
jgi:hypothetical protein